MNVTLVGLGLVGTSVGLALKAAAPEIAVVGHDPDAELVKRARAAGAIDRSHWNLPAACEGADIVLLDLSLDELDRTLRALGPSLDPSIVLIDAHPAKRAALAVAAAALPGTRRFVGGHIVGHRLVPGAAPAAGLLRDATFFLTPAPDAASDAVDLASTLAQALGTTPRFIDAAEHDGLFAAMSLLPLLGAVSFVDALAAGSGAAERRNVSTPEFTALAGLVAAPDIGARFGADADLLAPWVDIWIARLAHWRDALSTRDAAALASDLASIAGLAAVWQRSPDEKPSPSAERPGWRQMLLGGRRRPGRDSRGGDSRGRDS